MKREDLIQKWLDHALNAEELEAFKKLEDYEALKMLDKNMQYFKAPDFDEKQTLHHISESLKTKKQSSNWLQPLLRIAAIVVIAIGSFWFLNQNTDTNINTIAAQKTNINLPDSSLVNLNATSSITYNKNNWKNNREVILDGEAFFKVAKGSKFDVKTSEGTVTVLGTQFNVKQRNNYFEVVCYEGLVGVTYNNHAQKKLKPGESFLIIDEKAISKDNETDTKPHWTINESPFKSIPYKYVLAEFERQYNVTFKTENLDLNQLFTGSFTHDDYQVAIKSITLPLQLNYSINNNTITLKRE